MERKQVNGSGGKETEIKNLFHFRSVRTSLEIGSDRRGLIRTLARRRQAQFASRFRIVGFLLIEFRSRRRK